MDIKDNIISLLEEDLWCIHKYLDDIKIPRKNKDGHIYSIVDRIQKLEERHYKFIFDLEQEYKIGDKCFIKEDKFQFYNDIQYTIIDILEDDVPFKFVLNAEEELGKDTVQFFCKEELTRIKPKQ